MTAGTMRSLVVVTALAAIAACAEDRPTGAPVELGAAADSLTVDYCLLDVHTDDGTIHFEGPDWLLASVEGAGPLNLDLRELDFLIPTVTTTGNDKPKASTVSAAVGFSVQDRYGVNDYTRLAVASGTFQRVEAYADFQRTVFEVHDASCGAFLGTGAAYRPIGVYFRAVYAEDVALPDFGVHVYVPVDDGPPPVPAGTQPGDAGADAGADAGPPSADAGPTQQGVTAQTSDGG
jgi:hypothetical protein